MGPDQEDARMSAVTRCPRPVRLPIALIALLLPAAALAQVAPPAAATATAAAPAFTWKITGNWSVWALDQRNFFLGKDVPLDDADYVVQNVRVQARVGNDAVGGVLRLDAAQGWWGVDNSPDTEPAVSQQPDGTVSTSTAYNPYALFRNKDTNYGVHFDHAWLYVQAPWLPLRLEAGRQHFSVGNKLVLDQDLDGLRLISEPTAGVRVEAFWTKVSEGLGSYKSPVGALMNDDGQRDDADLYGAVAQVGRGDHRVELFGLHYRDRVPGWDWNAQHGVAWRCRASASDANQSTSVPASARTVTPATMSSTPGCAGSGSRCSATNSGATAVGVGMWLSCACARRNFTRSRIERRERSDMVGLAWCRGHVRATLRYGHGVAMAGFVGWIRTSPTCRRAASAAAAPRCGCLCRDSLRRVFAGRRARGCDDQTSRQR
ncbi:MAG: hypothetical protein H6747_15865 [Deltaproteobacteria bacterium]|nr:hypothetical protein [Deltaproteobacteria bacterium]